MVTQFIARLGDGLSYKTFLLLSLAGYIALFFFNLWNGSIKDPELIPFWDLAATPVEPLPARRAFIDSLYGRFRSVRMNVLQGLIIIFIFGIYLVVMANWDKMRFKIADIFCAGFTTAIAAFFILPTQSWDVYAYTEFGRLAAIYGLNPYLHGYASVSDAYSPWAWFGSPMPYGPGGLPIYMLAGILSESNVFIAIYFLKFVGFVTYGLSSWLLYQILKRRGKEPAFSLALFVMNPLLALNWC